MSTSILNATDGIKDVYDDDNAELLTYLQKCELNNQLDVTLLAIVVNCFEKMKWELCYKCRNDRCSERSRCLHVGNNFDFIARSVLKNVTEMPLITEWRCICFGVLGNSTLCIYFSKVEWTRTTVFHLPQGTVSYRLCFENVATIFVWNILYTAD